MILFVPSIFISLIPSWLAKMQIIRIVLKGRIVKM